MNSSAAIRSTALVLTSVAARTSKLACSDFFPLLSSVTHDLHLPITHTAVHVCATQRYSNPPNIAQSKGTQDRPSQHDWRAGNIH